MKLFLILVILINLHGLIQSSFWPVFRPSLTGYRSSYKHYYSNLYSSVKRADNEQKIDCTVTKLSLKCEEVECDIISHLNEVNLRFDMFGIELVNNEQFRLFPKLFTDSKYSNYQVPLTNGNTADLMLFSSSSSANSTLNFKGLMVKTATCFSKLVDLFKSVKFPLSSQVEFGNSMSRNVLIYGFIFEV